jgi:hypothetical protein
MSERSASERAGSIADAVLESAADLAAAGRHFLASERGQKLRRNMATAVIIGAPVLSELPIFRRTIIGRLLRTAAVGTLLVKGAEWLREWEPVGPIDLGPS